MKFIDQINNTIQLDHFPERIVSLVPSQTELLYDLGLEERVKGITKFCIHPESWFRSKARVGGTKQVDFQKVADLRPDLIIANKEENEKSQILALQEIAPVWVSDINTLEEAFEMIYEVGRLTNTSEKAKTLIREIDKGFADLKQSFESGVKNKRAAYYIWYNPEMLAGKKTFIDDMLIRAGFVNCVEADRYPLEKDIKLIDPEVILLSSEPFPFKEKHIGEFRARFPKAEVRIVDGEMFSWYGSRLTKAPAYFKSLFNASSTLENH